MRKVEEASLKFSQKEVDSLKLLYTAPNTLAIRRVNADILTITFLRVESMAGSWCTFK